MAKKKRGPTRNDFQKCAAVAHEFNEWIALGELGPLLEAEDDHAYLCQVGVWYWQLGHRELASACYRRSIEIQPEVPTYLNLAVCIDDMAAQLDDVHAELRKQLREEAVRAIRACYSLTSNAKERSAIRAMLTQNGKEHLARRRAKKSTPRARKPNKPDAGDAK